MEPVCAQDTAIAHGGRLEIGHGRDIGIDLGLLDVLKASEGADQRDDGDQNTDSHLHGGDATLGLFAHRLAPRAESR